MALSCIIDYGEVGLKRCGTQLGRRLGVEMGLKKCGAQLGHTLGVGIGLKRCGAQLGCRLGVGIGLKRCGKQSSSMGLDWMGLQNRWMEGRQLD